MLLDTPTPGITPVPGRMYVLQGESGAATPPPGVSTSTPDILGGTPVFRGTRVPIQTLIEYLEGGQTIDDFLEGFPTVTREQVIAFLEEAKTRMLAVAS